MNKKIFRSAFYAFGAAALLSGFASCSDDKVESTTLNLDDKVLTEGITSEIDGLYKKIDVTSNSDWTISVEADSSWIAVTDTVGHGNQTVAVNIEPMYGSSVGRQAKIRLRSANVERVIDVKQLPTFQGEDVQNDAESDKYVLTKQKGLGCGYSLSGKILTKACCINIEGALKVLANQENGRYKYLHTYNPLTELRSTGATIDSVERKADSLKVKMQFDISYSAFKLNIEGSYKGNANKVHLKNSYNYAGKYDIAETSLNILDALEYYKEAKEAKDSGDKESVSCYTDKISLFTPTLAKVINNLDTLATSTRPTATEDFNKAVKAAVSKFGIGFVAEAELGARLELSMKYDRDSICEKMSIDSATVAASVKGFLQLGVKVDYSKFATTIFDNSAYQYNIAGGSKNSAIELDKLLSKTRKDGDESIYEEVQDKIIAWKQSISADDASTLTVTHVGIIKLWELLEPEAADKCRDYITKTYKTQIDKLFPDGLD